LRIAVPSALAGAVLGMRSAALGVALLALAHCIAMCACGLHGSVAQACAQSAAYGDEIRRPLRTPPLLCLVLVLAMAVIDLGIATGPLLLADGRVAAGIIVCVIGLPVAALLIRSVHSLSQRFIVFVPAGFVVSDSLTLPDPVLLPREKITRIAPAPADAHPDGIDTRLGALAGAIVVDLDEPGTFTVRQGRGMATRTASSLWCTPLRPTSVLGTAAERRLGAVNPAR
jgi:hypothetical protein